MTNCVAFAPVQFSFTIHKIDASQEALKAIGCHEAIIVQCIHRRSSALDFWITFHDYSSKCSNRFSTVDVLSSPDSSEVSGVEASSLSGACPGTTAKVSAEAEKGKMSCKFVFYIVLPDTYSINIVLFIQV